MGAYLNKPVTEKHSESGSNNRVRYAATTMQGWRINQEDAHNCILDFDDSVSMFAVYDGHGGSEVAQYTAIHFPQFLKSRDDWKAGNYAKAIEGSFLDFDDLLRSDKVMKELKKMAKNPPSKLADKELSDDEDKAALYEEASMPLESILQRYGFVLRRGRNGTTESVKTFEEIENEDEDSEKVAESDSNGESEIKINGDDLKADGDKSTDKAKKRTGEIPRIEESGVKRVKPNGEDDSDQTVISTSVSDTSEDVIADCHETPPSVSADAMNVVVCSSNGDAPDEGKVDKKRTTDENCPVQKIGEKGKQPVVECCSKSDEIPQPSATSETDSNSEQDEDYNGDEEDLSEVEEEEESELEDIDEDEERYDFGGPTGDMPGEDSGTTACVAMVFKDKVIVGNAGDSRAVLCRGGIAVDLSLDHKPEDEIERVRIEAAGGQISIDGRVNGGLNLSRALGDHFYKKNVSLPLKDQMISALPDITEHTIDENDEFIIVACDGIWNSMTNEEVVQFVKDGLDSGKSLNEICNQVCEHCLSPHSAGDGTGCDNMTIIIAQILHPPARTNELD